MSRIHACWCDGLAPAVPRSRVNFQAHVETLAGDAISTADYRRRPTFASGWAGWSELNGVWILVKPGFDLSEHSEAVQLSVSLVEAETQLEIGEASLRVYLRGFEGERPTP